MVGGGLDSRNLWVAIFSPGELVEIEAEPEQVERPGSSCPGKEAGKGFWAPNQGGANPILEMKLRKREWVCHRQQRTASAPGRS